MRKARRKEITVEALLYTHYTRKEEVNGKIIETHPVKIRVTSNRVKKFYPVQVESENLFLTADQWDKREKNKKTNNVISDFKARARAAVEKVTFNRPFSFDLFEKEFLQQESEKGLIVLWEERILRLKKKKRIGTRDIYSTALNSFRAFRKNKEIRPEDLTVEVLEDFEDYLKNERQVISKKGKTLVRKGCDKTTIGMYADKLRAIYSIAASKTPSLLEFYPFARKGNDENKYKIKRGSGHKGEPLSINQLVTLINTDPPQGSQEWIAKQYWLFSFYCHGMNMKDIAHLQYGNIQVDQNTQLDVIRHVRKKTEETEAVEELMQIPLHDEIKEIIQHLGNREKNSDSYIFNILEPGMDAEQQATANKTKINWVNKWIKRLASVSGLPEITTYWARHTYANMLNMNGEPMNVIREHMGHSEQRTTENYVKNRFGLEKTKEVNDRILDRIKRLK